MKNLNDNNVRSNENEQNGHTSMKHRVRAYLSKTLVVFMSMILVWGTSPITQLVYAEELNNVEAYSTEAASSTEGEGQAVSDEGATPAAESTESSSVTTTAADTTTPAAVEGSTATSSTESTSTDTVNLVAESSDEDADETATSEEEGIALASNEQDDTVTPGTYGRYTYKQNSLKNAFETSEYDSYRDPVATQWLGIAGSFHITGFDEVNTSSHIYGNILTKTLNGSNNFGQTSWYENTYGYRPLSYVQNYTTPSSNPSGINDSVFVIGSGSKVTTVDNGSHLAIDGVQLNEPKTLIQDTDTATAPFIDLDAVKAKTIEVSDSLARVADVGASVSKEGSNTYINYEGDSGCAYVTFKASELNSMDQLYIKGMALNGSCSVVVNVEMDTNTLNLSKVHVLLPNGQTAGTGETDSTVGYVMFNIKNSTSAMTISLSDRVLASVLAPNSTINLGGSAAGTFIGSKVNVTAESHARPFRGTLKPVVDTLSVKKVWKDAYGNEEPADVANAHGAVTVKVYQRSKAKDASDWGAWTEYETVTLSKDNGWAKSWTNLPKRDTNGTTYEYKIDEVSQTADYDSTVSNDGGAWTITNQHKAVTKLSVKKVWDDEDDVDGLRSTLFDKVTFKVLRSVKGEKTQDTGLTIELTSADGSWQGSLDNLDKYDAEGNEYTYSLKEVLTDAQKAEYEGKIEVSGPKYDTNKNASYTFTATNTHKGKKVSVKVAKKWEDNDNKANKRPTSVKVQLYTVDAEGNLSAVEGKTATLEDGKWSAEWGNLPKNEAGKKISYTVRELDASGNPLDEGAELDNGYAVSYDGEGSYSFTVTNTYEDKGKVSLSVEKAWDDEDDVDGLRPESIKVEVKRSVEGGKAETVKTLELEAGEDGSWKASLSDLPKYDADGSEYAYGIDEVKVEGYDVKTVEATPTTDDNGNVSYSFSLTNTHKAEKVSVKVAKKWEDNDNKANKRPTSVKVQLYTVDAEGNLSAVEGKTATLEDGKWSAEWGNLPKNEAGKKISYTVRELDASGNPLAEGAELDNGYAVTYESDGYGTDTYSYTVTNTYEEEEQAFTLSGYSMAAEAAPVSEPDKVCYVDPKIYKKLEGRALTAGEFSFRLVDDKTGAIISTAENDEAGMVDFDAANNVGTKENPTCLKFTAPGTYTYTVRENPDKSKDLSIDYSTEVVKFVTTIGKDSNGALYEEESHYVVYASQADADAATNNATRFESSEHPTITNKVKSLHIALTKTDANTGAKLAGATYGLYRVDDSASTGSVLVATATSGSNGVMTFTAGDTNGIAASGTYYFQEISAPDGYAVSEAKTCEFTIEKANDGTYTLAYKDGTVSDAAHAGTAADPIVFKPGTGVTDTKIAITFGKVSSDGTALSGAKLAVRDEAGNDVASWTTDGKGYVVSGLVVGAKYVLYEKAAPEGYAKAAEVTFTVDEYGKVSIVGGASYNSLLNAYATGSQLNLVDYKQTELENKQEVVREKGVSEKKGTKPSKSSMPATGDNSRFSVIPAIVGTLMIAAGLATRRRREE